VGRIGTVDQATARLLGAVLLVLLCIDGLLFTAAMVVRGSPVVPMLWALSGLRLATWAVPMAIGARWLAHTNQRTLVGLGLAVPVSIIAGHLVMAPLEMLGPLRGVDRYLARAIVALGWIPWIAAVRRGHAAWVTALVVVLAAFVAGYHAIDAVTRLPLLSRFTMPCCWRTGMLAQLLVAALLFTAGRGGGDPVSDSSRNQAGRALRQLPRILALGLAGWAVCVAALYLGRSVFWSLAELAVPLVAVGLGLAALARYVRLPDAATHRTAVSLAGAVLLVAALDSVRTRFEVGVLSRTANLMEGWQLFALALLIAAAGMAISVTRTARWLESPDAIHWGRRLLFVVGTTTVVAVPLLLWVEHRYLWLGIASYPAVLYAMVATKAAADLADALEPSSKPALRSPRA